MGLFGRKQQPPNATIPSASSTVNDRQALEARVDAELHAYAEELTSVMMPYVNQGLRLMSTDNVGTGTGRSGDVKTKRHRKAYFSVYADSTLWRVEIHFFDDFHAFSLDNISRLADHLRRRYEPEGYHVSTGESRGKSFEVYVHGPSRQSS